MIKKFAVASSDGKVINQHFGRAGKFYIFEVVDEGYKLVDIRANRPPCPVSAGDESLMDQTIELISDCQLVLAVRIGLGALTKLKQKGIKGIWALGPMVAETFDHYLGQCEKDG
ncbi:NifB/NifX family molybdenum-iron cluster-binding protein [Carboxydocella sp. ULO1]|uniref:NifB/NifX family molybdenum-iron cluster-binding protein n=1 Tax=Carboxydocella sp. ULO1 TaxID=1926599 RepID=UPI0009C7162A|nr:NifB/NifX family molybdenum-iron cluster-binding protein [Carboxydocella sp. ULO1]GAW28507.1 hypothetical protein ULO1_10770 [Carboxydocella sp. ULO1]